MLDKFEMKMDAFLPLRDVVFQTLRQAILRFLPANAADRSSIALAAA